MSIVGYPVGRMSLGGASALLVVVACVEGTKPPSPPTTQVASVDVSPLTATLPGGTILQFDAVARASSGMEIPGVEITWSSENPSVATVSETGLVAAVAIQRRNCSAAAFRFRDETRVCPR